MPNYTSIDHLGIVCLREELPDFFRDYAALAPKLLELYDAVDEDYVPILRDIIELCRPYEADLPQRLNRVYVTTEYFYPSLVLSNLPANALTVLRSNIGPHVWAPVEPARDSRNDIKVWIFEGKKMADPVLITPSMFGQMLIAFYQDNLIAREHIRRNWMS